MASRPPPCPLMRVPVNGGTILRLHLHVRHPQIDAALVDLAPEGDHMFHLRVVVNAPLGAHRSVARLRSMHIAFV